MPVRGELIMLSVILNMRLDLHHLHSNIHTVSIPSLEIAGLNYVGIHNRGNFVHYGPNKLGRHPFNVITEEIFND